jgi:hypothetical protein
LTYCCEICTRTADQPVRYFLHLLLGHPIGDLARAVEPSLLGGTHISESPPTKPRIWDRWDKGGRSGPPTRRPGP